MLKTKDLMARERAILAGLRAFVLELPGYWRTFCLPGIGRKQSPIWRVVPPFVKFVAMQTAAIVTCGWSGHAWCELGNLRAESGVIETICTRCGEDGPREVLW